MRPSVNNRPSFDEVYIRCCNILAERSTCKRRKVGAFLVTTNHRQVVSVGYNGPARGLPNDICTGLQGSCGCIHAELNCLLPSRPNGEYILYVSCTPCSDCIKHIINVPDITEVCYHEEYTTKRLMSEIYNVETLIKSGIKVRKI